MARDDVLLKAWQSAEFARLSRGAQALFNQLVIHGGASSAGVLPLMPAKWAAGCSGETEASVMNDLGELTGASWVVVDTAKFEVLIRNFIRDSRTHRNPNHFRGALNAARAVDSVPLRRLLAVELDKFNDPSAAETIEILTADMDSEGIGDASDSHPARSSDAGEVG